MRHTLALVVGFAALATAAPAGTLGRRMDLTCTFPAQNCQYTLIGDDWNWREQLEPLILFSAENKKGIIVTLATGPIPPNSQLTAEFAQQFEATAFGKQKLTKRGGHFVVFQGEVSYQSETRLASGNTMACRVFFAHGVCYALAVIGDKAPIEKDPDFEAITNGFTYAEKPAGSDGATTTWFKEHAAYTLGGFLILIIVLGVVMLPGRTAR